MLFWQINCHTLDRILSNGYFCGKKDIMVICVDFDGTCTTHEFPKVGTDIGAAPVLKELVQNGHKLILWTMRSNGFKGNYLDDAIAWFKRNNIPLYGVQENPEQFKWTASKKCYAHLYIDDSALGCPLTQDYYPHPDGHYAEAVPIGRPYVDWVEVRKLLVQQGLIKE